ncbi:MAG: type II toxin-antitoxin system mRNA interferase toxin, RelE/StbE family [Candidatus ainarchaeum sp.]|nr:type II toxin-antitoxin system mRNA interferase toxin, RelE/StbE family [Candidatus ainarchaeum sp.]
MVYGLKVKPSLEKIFGKIGKKGPEQLDAIEKRIKQILEDPYGFKPLGATLKNKRRVHIYKSFVLVYEIHENERTVELWDYDNHDNIYKK